MGRGGKGLLRDPGSVSKLGKDNDKEKREDNHNGEAKNTHTYSIGWTGGGGGGRLLWHLITVTPIRSKYCCRLCRFDRSAKFLAIHTTRFAFNLFLSFVDILATNSKSRNTSGRLIEPYATAGAHKKKNARTSYPHLGRSGIRWCHLSYRQPLGISTI